MLLGTNQVFGETKCLNTCVTRLEELSEIPPAATHVSRLLLKKRDSITQTTLKPRVLCSFTLIVVLSSIDLKTSHGVSRGSVTTSLETIKDMTLESG